MSPSCFQKLDIHLRNQMRIPFILLWISSLAVMSGFGSGSPDLVRSGVGSRFLTNLFGLPEVNADFKICALMLSAGSGVKNWIYISGCSCMYQILDLDLGNWI